MDFSEKPQVRRLRVLHGPHRIHVSGVAVPRVELPVEDTLPTYLVGDTELVGDVFEAPVELVTLPEKTPRK